MENFKTGVLVFIFLVVAGFYWNSRSEMKKKLPVAEKEEPLIDLSGSENSQNSLFTVLRSKSHQIDLVTGETSGQKIELSLAAELDDVERELIAREIRDSVSQVLSVRELEELECKSCYVEQVIAVDEIDLTDKIQFFQELVGHEKLVEKDSMNQYLTQLMEKHPDSTYDQLSQMMDMYSDTLTEPDEMERFDKVFTRVSFYLSKLSDPEERRKGYVELTRLYPRNAHRIEGLLRLPASAD